MTKIQWMIIGVLGAAVVILFSCLVCVLLGRVAIPLSGDRVTSESSATAIPEVQPTEQAAVAVATPTQVPTRTPATPPKSPTPKPQIKLEVGSYSSYSDSPFPGYLTFVGEVLNKGDTPAWRIQVAVSLLDGGGNIVGVSSNNMANLNVIPARGKYPFLIRISKPSPYKEVKIQVQGEPYGDSSLFPPYLDLRVEGVTGKAPGPTGPISPSGNGYILRGRINNTGNKTATSVKVVAIAYDQNGKVMDVGFTYSELDQIQAGGNAPFELQLSTIKATPPKYELFAQGTEKK